MLVDRYIALYPEIESTSDEIRATSENTDEMINSLEKLKTASEGISSLSSAFNELSDNGYITIDTITSIKDAVGNSISNWDEYEKKLLTVKKGTDEYNRLMCDLTYATLENQLGVKGLANAEEEYIARLLQENGVLNANKIAQEAIAKAKATEFRASQGTSVAYEDSSTRAQEAKKNVQAMMEEATAAGIDTNAYAKLLVQEIMLNNNSLTVNGKLAALGQIAKYAGVATVNLQTLNDVINGVEGATNKYQFATDNGIEVHRTGKPTKKKNAYGDYVDANGNVTNKENAADVENWQYEYDGITYETLKEATPYF